MALLERSYAAAHAGDEALSRKLGEVAAHSYLRDRKGFRKFRNLKGIARLEQAEYVLHPLALRKRRDRLVAFDARDPNGMGGRSQPVLSKQHEAKAGP